MDDIMVNLGPDPRAFMRQITDDAICGYPDFGILSPEERHGKD